METTVANEFVSEEAKQVSSRVMQMIEDGKIRNHKLGNTSLIHHGNTEEKELGNYTRFLLTRNFDDVIHLCGQVNYEEY